jgi:hypothetical protein
MMNTENLYLSSITNSTTKEYETKKSMFDMSKNRTTLVYNKIEMVRRTTFICSSTCRKAEHVEQPEAIVLNAMETSLYGTNMENTDAGLLLYSNQYKHNAIHDNHINNTFMGMQITGYTTGGAYDNFITDVHAHFTPSPYGGSTFWGKGIE